MVRTDGPVLTFASADDWAAWLAEEHDSSDGLWLKMAKRETGIASVTYAEAVEVALCYGWIDGQKASAEKGHWLQRFTPRRPRSKWSKVNCGKATALIESGRMQPAGLREVERAKADGRWEAAYEPPSTAFVPDDLVAALAAEPAAAAAFATLNSANRYAILFRIHDAKRPETRARRIAKFVDMLGRGEKLYP
ncbi:MAG: YdeI/OmpD-associated family protein [Actinomycetota bacterium]|nr:YdeI/OmpD-associated family protein [Actinomycetota bacterium]